MITKVPDNDLEEDGGPSAFPTTAEAINKEAAVIWVSTLLECYSMSLPFTSSPTTYIHHALGYHRILCTPTAFFITSLFQISIVSESSIHDISSNPLSSPSLPILQVDDRDNNKIDTASL